MKGKKWDDEPSQRLVLMGTDAHCFVKGTPNYYGRWDDKH